MRKIYLSVLLASALVFSHQVKAEEDIFGNEENTFLEQTAQEQKKIESQNNLSSFLESRLPSSLLRNLRKPEKIFCYTVDYMPPSYEGYAVNELALNGSCGELSNDGKQIIFDAVLKNTSLFSNSVDKCNISPKIMLRYVNGIDYTDVLFSYPCPSLTFFHGRDVITLNAAPGGEIIEKIAEAYGKLNEKFLSPALLGQMVGNGQVITQDQKEIVRRLSPSETSLKKWGNENNQPAITEQTKPAAKSGWNKLK